MHHQVGTLVLQSTTKFGTGARQSLPIFDTRVPQTTTGLMSRPNSGTRVPPSSYPTKYTLQELSTPTHGVLSAGFHGFRNAWHGRTGDSSLVSPGFPVRPRALDGVALAGEDELGVVVGHEARPVANAHDGEARESV